MIAVVLVVLAVYVDHPYSQVSSAAVFLFYTACLAEFALESFTIATHVDSENPHPKTCSTPNCYNLREPPVP